MPRTWRRGLALAYLEFGVADLDYVTICESAAGRLVAVDNDRGGVVHAFETGAGPSAIDPDVVFGDCTVSKNCYGHVPGATNDGALVVEDELPASHFTRTHGEPHLGPKRVDQGNQRSHENTNDDDCDDTDPDVNPAASEICNAIDDNCDDVADSSQVCPCEVHYYDSFLLHFKNKIPPPGGRTTKRNGETERAPFSKNDTRDATTKSDQFATSTQIFGGFFLFWGCWS